MFDLEDPFPLSVVSKAFCFDPLQVFVWVTSTCPFPEFLEYVVINICESSLTCRMSMKVGLTSNG